MRQMYYSKRYTELTRGRLSWMLWCLPWRPSSGLRHSFLQLLGKRCLLVACLSVESLPKNCPWLKEATSPKVTPLAGQPGSSWREGPEARPPCLSWRHLWRVFPASEFRPPHHSWTTPSVLLFPLLCHGAVCESTPQQSPAHKTSSPSLSPRKPNLQSWWLHTLEAGSTGFFVDTNHCILERPREAEGRECWKTVLREISEIPPCILADGWLFRATAAGLKPGVLQAQTFSISLNFSHRAWSPRVLLITLWGWLFCLLWHPWEVSC